MKRICLFAGYDSQASIQEYVVHLLQQLSEVSDVYCCFDVDYLEESELIKIIPYVKDIHIERHGKYDFGSWSLLLSKVCIDTLSSADEMLLVNDSFYGPMFPLENMLKEMESRKADFWGITKSNEFKPHLQSYFLAFRKRVFLNQDFRKFFETVKQERTKLEIVRNYEVKLTAMLEDLGYSYSSFYEDETSNNTTKNWLTLIEAGVPLIKCSVLMSSRFRNESEAIYLLPKLCEKNNYPFTFIENHLKSKKLNFEDLIFQQMLYSTCFNSWSAARIHYGVRKWPENVFIPLIIGIFHVIYSAIRGVYHSLRSLKDFRQRITN